MLNKLRALGVAALLALAFFGTFAPHAAFSQATQILPGESCFQATTGINGFIGAIGTIAGGSGGTAGTYGGVALTGSATGSGATANITVSGGAVTGVAILNPGINYVVGDSLSAASASIGNVTGFSVPVNSIAINSAVAGGSVGMYLPGTLTAAQTWQDTFETALNPTLIPLDSNGCAVIFGVGAYRQIVFDSLGNQVWDRLTYGQVGIYGASTIAGNPTGSAGPLQPITVGTGLTFTGTTLYATGVAGITGEIRMFAMQACPSGWHAADGSALSRTGATANLFSAIGTTYGAGNGTTTFNIPNGQGQFVRQFDASGLVDPGRTFGSTQAQALATTAGTITSGTGTISGTTGAVILASGTSLGSNGTAGQAGNSPVTGTATITSGVVSVGTGTDTRPTNIAYQQCISY